MSRRPLLSLVLLCLAIVGARLVWPSARARVSVRVLDGGCRVGQCTRVESLLTGGIACSGPWRLACGAAAPAGAGAEEVGCGCAPARHCLVSQSGRSRVVSCGSKLKLDNGDVIFCHCDD